MTGFSHNSKSYLLINGLSVLWIKVIWSENFHYELESFRNCPDIDRHYQNQSVHINKTAAEVLTVLTDFGFTIAAQSEHSAGNFITWTLVRKEPFLVIRRNSVELVESDNNCELTEAEPLSSNFLEREYLYEAKSSDMTNCM